MPSERQAGDCRCAKDLRVIGENESLKAANERLKAGNARLREQLGKVRRTALEQPFGLSAPSSKRLVKPNAPEPSRRRRSPGSAGSTSRTATRATPSSSCAPSAPST